jgi:SAM-dependent MidA family methyltransferase
MSLTEMIREKIRTEGPVSFYEFMELCLYEPAFGYYTSAKEKIGESGDFYTSPYFSSLFGEMIAKQIVEMWEHLGREPFTIVEYGAGPGDLCRDILLSLKKNELLYQNLRYCIIEKSASMRAMENQRLSEKVSWYQKIEDIPDLIGCVLSNELIDNFAVHQVVMQHELMEVFVDYQNGFTEVLHPAEQRLKNYFEELGVQLPDGFRTEVNLEAITWIRDIAMAIKKGFVLTIDYGLPSSILYNEKRKKGTLRCYYQHAQNDNPYQHLGEQDITTHVNFSALAHWGSHYGLSCAGFTHQAHFLQALGLAAHLKIREKENTVADQREKEKLIYTFLLEMGTRLKVLIQQKGEKQGRLSGLQFAQNYV